MQMNLFENIKIFIEIVDAGSFAQAAENLQIHRPAVTKALQQLEQESGVRLLQRTTRRLYLTPEGEEFYRRSKPLLSQADDLLESFAPDRPIRGQLRVDMPIAFARLLVIPHLPDFYQAHPEVEIVLSSSDVRRDMLRDGLDCLLRVGDLEDGDYVARSLGEVALTTCASPGYLARYGAPATLEDLQSHLAVNWVNSSSRQIMPWRFQTPEGIRQIAIPGKLVLDNSEVFTAAGLAGLGMLQGMRFFCNLISTAGNWWKFCRTFRRRVDRCRCSIRTGISRIRFGSLPTGCRGWWRPWTDNRRCRLDSIG